MKIIMLSFFVLIAFNQSFGQVEPFDELNANFGTNRKIEWFTSGYGNGYGHKIYNHDPGGMTLLNFAARNNSSTWSDIMTITSNGKVGIGTTSPSFKLSVEGEIGITKNYPYIQFNSTSWGSNSFIQTGVTTAAQANGDYMVFRNPNSKGFNFRQGSYNALTIQPNGNVGVGTTNPDSKITIDGTISTTKSSYTKFQLARHDWSGSHAILFNAYKDYSVSGSLETTGNTKYANNTGAYSGGAGSIMFLGNGGIMDFLISPASVGMGESINWGGPKMRINRQGEVGIGTTDMDGYRLSVGGNIRAEEVKVEASPWPDFVFEKEYKLSTLEEVEKHISEKGHLPEIPSKAEVRENGIKLGEMNAKLLRKIEELTLYLIEQNKKNQEQSRLIEELQKEVSALMKK